MAGVAEARFDQGHEVDDGTHRQALTDDSGAEEALELGQIEAATIVEDGAAHARFSRRCFDEVMGIQHQFVFVFTVGGAEVFKGGAQELDGASRARHSGPHMVGDLRQAAEEGLAVVEVELEPLAVVPCHMLGGFIEDFLALAGQGLGDIDELEEAAKSRPLV